MKIEALIHREGGSLVEVGESSYHFAPDAEGRHVCMVDDEQHAERLLSIKEGYRSVEAEKAEEKPVVAPRKKKAPEAEKAEEKA